MTIIILSISPELRCYDIFVLPILSRQASIRLVGSTLKDEIKKRIRAIHRKFDEIIKSRQALYIKISCPASTKQYHFTTKAFDKCLLLIYTNVKNCSLEAQLEHIVDKEPIHQANKGIAHWLNLSSTLFITSTCQFTGMVLDLR